MKDREYYATFIGSKDGRVTIRHTKNRHVTEDSFVARLTTKMFGWLYKSTYTVPKLWQYLHLKGEREGDFGNWDEEIIFLIDPVTLQPPPLDWVLGLTEKALMLETELKNKDNALNALRALTAAVSHGDMKRKEDHKTFEDFGDSKKKLQQNPFYDSSGFQGR